MKSVTESMWKLYRFEVGWVGRQFEDFSMYLKGPKFCGKSWIFEKVKKVQKPKVVVHNGFNSTKYAEVVKGQKTGRRISIKNWKTVVFQFFFLKKGKYEE